MNLTKLTAAEFASVNPILHADEIGIEKDTGLVKIGDGATSWANLPYTIERQTGLTSGGSGDNATKLQTAASALPSIANYFTDPDSHTYAPEGGGTITIPPGVYALGSMVHLKPRTKISAYGVTIILTAAGAGFDVPSTQGGTFSADNVSIEGLTIDGNNIGTTALQLYATSYTHLRDVNVVRCTSHGIRLTGAQWSQFDTVVSWYNGGYGVYLEPYNPGVGNSPTANNNRFVNLYCQRNGSGGLGSFGDNAANTYLGCTFQFHPSGAGVYDAGGYCNQFIGCYFEQNQIQIWFDSATSNGSGVGTGNQIISPLFWAGTGTERYVVNAQNNVTLVSPVSDAYGPQTLKGAQTTYNAYEQSSTTGSMTVVNPYRIATPAKTPFNMFCDENGNATDPSLARMANNKLQVIESDERQVSTKTNYVERPYVGTATSDLALSGKLSGDTYRRWQIQADGSFYLGSGAAATDAGINRPAAAQVGVTGSLRPMGSGTLGVSGAPWGTIYYGAAYPNASLMTAGSGSPNGVVAANPGSRYTDYAAGAEYLKATGTGNTGWRLTGFTPYTTAGRPTASAAGAGGSYYDTTLNKPGWSDGTNWRDASGTLI